MFKCRVCQNVKKKNVARSRTFCISKFLSKKSDLKKIEKSYELKVVVCDNCSLVQTTSNLSLKLFLIMNMPI